MPDPQAPPARVDRLIVHQFDPARSSPGGIDTCLRGMTRYLPEDAEVAVVGVDTGVGHPGRELGRWERHDLGEGRSFWFLPVAALDPAEGARRVPHAARLMAGLARYRSRVPQARVVQVHSLNSALGTRVLLRRPQAYFIHTQDHGLTGATSDSFWRFAADAYSALERRTVGAARDVVVFNEDYAGTVRGWNPRARFSPTWFDPALITNLPDAERDPHHVVWVGRMEVPKDPALAVSAFAALVEADPGSPWRLDLLGQGSLLEPVRQQVAALPAATAERITVAGRVAPPEVARRMGTAGVFLMTSHPGYEGYPRVLVEAMASGLPAVVTDGSDTGGLVVDGKTGYVTDRDPATIAARVREAAGLERSVVRDAVADLSAPVLIERIYSIPAA
ncbi:glycosyltransferase family 4 protein [Microlunatus flavus]|uniref:Glycosyltransferase involved in cell wall bisynthesis n=1 Tax=Microlunatus flavus TaxID=1036181 RepID=A0A1H9H7U1_9ACTN|nr:glycosyltransferase family 4 protein [Microlunatus flavus]SEQ58298.1 Glycosyltransferase involved in cell wall bisynthesis [Microlunatus flavus]